MTDGYLSASLGMYEDSFIDVTRDLHDFCVLWSDRKANVDILELLGKTTTRPQ
jgi:hypothetical protein